MTVPYFQTNNLEEEIMLHAEAHKRKFTFSIGYALACGLIFEGCFSMLYHFYPTKLTFQFDKAQLIHVCHFRLDCVVIV